MNKYRPDNERTYCNYCKQWTFDNAIASCIDCANDIVRNPHKLIDKLKSNARIQQAKDIKNK